MTKALDKILPKIALPVIAIAGIMLVFTMISVTQNTNNENNAYIRVINCIVTHNASERTQQDIENCYLTVERDLNIKLQRYDGTDK